MDAAKDDVRAGGGGRVDRVFGLQRVFEDDHGIEFHSRLWNVVDAFILGIRTALVKFRIEIKQFVANRP